MTRYSLADHILTVTIPANLANEFGVNTLTIGGEGSYTSSISVSLSSQLWSTEGDASGSWAHNKNLNRTGTVTVQINQLSEKIAKFITLCNLYYKSNVDYDGLTLVVESVNNGTVATCTDCYIQGIPSQDFGASAANQQWTFTCGKIIFN